LLSDSALACPRCRHSLQLVSEELLRCPQDGLIFPRENGVWLMLAPEQADRFAQFIRDYETIRQAEGRESPQAEYYRRLPFQDITGRRSAEWAIRAQGFRTLLERIIRPMEQGRSLRIIDLGAGNGWLSYQLAKRGHQLAAVDLTVNCFDGLGALRHYDRPILALQASFDSLPLADQQLDLAIFNASLHYSPHYETTLAEALRLLKQNGVIAVVDSPIYRDGRSGAQMVRERHAAFRRRYGFASDAIDSENYLTYGRLESISDTLGLRHQIYWPVPPWRSQIRRWRTRLRGQREPAQFPVILWGK
jgi:SAM-dependent methyltransferase